MASETELAWAAGFYEGEGSIGSYSQSIKSKRSRLVLTVDQVYREPLDRFHSAVVHGTVRGPYARKGARAKHKPIYIYYVSRFGHVIDVLRHLWPNLSTRRKQQARQAVKEAMTAYFRPKAKTGPKKYV